MILPATRSGTGNTEEVRGGVEGGSGNTSTHIRIPVNDIYRKTPALGVCEASKEELKMEQVTHLFYLSKED
jgi:hypothetical protein